MKRRNFILWLGAFILVQKWQWVRNPSNSGQIDHSIFIKNGWILKEADV